MQNKNNGKTQTVYSLKDIRKIIPRKFIKIPVTTGLGEILRTDRDVYDTLASFIRKYAGNDQTGYIVSAFGLRMLQSFSPGNSVYPMPLNLSGKSFFVFPTVDDVIHWLVSTSQLISDEYPIEKVSLPPNVRRALYDVSDYISVGISSDDDLFVAANQKLRHKPKRYDINRIKNFLQMNSVNARKRSRKPVTGTNARPSPSEHYVPNSYLFDKPKNNWPGKNPFDEDVLKIIDAGIFPGDPGSQGFFSRVSPDTEKPELEYTAAEYFHRIGNNRALETASGVVLFQLLEIRDSEGLFLSVGVIYNDRLGPHRVINSKNQCVTPLSVGGLVNLDYSVYVVTVTNAEMRVVLMAPYDMSPVEKVFPTERLLDDKGLPIDKFSVHGQEVLEPHHLAHQVLKNYNVNLDPKVMVVLSDQTISIDPSNFIPNQDAAVVDISLAAACPKIVPTGAESWNNHGLIVSHVASPAPFTTYNLNALNRLFPTWKSINLVSYAPEDVKTMLERYAETNNFKIVGDGPAE